MKIALVCKNYAIERGGMERYTVLLGRQLLAAGHEVHVFANTWQKEPGIITHHVPVLRFPSSLKNFSFAWFAHRELSKVKLDVIHAMERLLYQDIYRVSVGISPVQLIQRYPNRLIRWFKSIGIRRTSFTYLEKKIFEKNGCKHIMTNSNLVKNQVLKHYHVDQKKITVIHNGVDTSIFNPQVQETYRASVRKKYNITDNTSVIIFVAHDFKLKRLDTILKALKLLDKNKYMLLVVGNGKKKNYVKWAVKNGLDERVLFLGPKKNMEQYYAAADIFVLPTLYDAFANVCVEAMACGLPVITTQTNGFAELIKDGENGFVLESQNPCELADKINAVSAELGKSMTVQNVSAAALELTMSRHMCEVLQLYEKVISPA
jgi:UDP-glucose:(heptosyl)LPS alpha-1,3-glucosyltransferase